MPIVPATRIEVRDEGATQGFVRTVDFVGAGVAATVSGTIATVTWCFTVEVIWSEVQAF